MLLYKIEPIFMKEGLPLDQAFDIIFSDETLHKVHGDKISPSPFVNNRRIVHYKITAMYVPAILKPYLAEPYVNSIMNQRLERSKSNWILYVDIKIDLFLGHLITVFCKFVVFKKHGKTYFGGYVKHDIAIPEPIKSIGEHYLAQHSKREVEMFEKTIRESQPT